MDATGDRTQRSLSLTSSGVTLLGVLLSIGVTVGMGISGPWWVRLLAGVATTVVLTVVVKLASAAGHGPLARLARWVLGDEEEPDAPPR